MPERILDGMHAILVCNEARSRDLLTNNYET